MSAVLAAAIADASAVLGHGVQRCFHCGQQLPGDSTWQAVVAGSAERMCGEACAAAAQAIDAAGCAAYYAARTEFAAPASVAPMQAQELAELDALALDGEAGFKVDGIRCATCAWLIERRLRQLPGVLDARLDIERARLVVRWNQARCSAGTILTALRAIGFLALPCDARLRGERLDQEHEKMRRQLFVAGLSALQVMMMALPFQLAARGAEAGAPGALLAWASMVLTLPAVLYAAQPFYGSAWIDLRRARAGMDLPVALAIVAGFAGSCVALASGEGETIFGAVSLFIFLLLACRYLALGARRRAAGALERLQQRMPASAQRLRGDPIARHTELVAAGALRIGDLVLVQAGQVAPLDGVIHEGEAEIDLALPGAASRMRRCGPGDAMPGGAINAGQAVVLRATALAQDSTLAVLVRLAERAPQGAPALALRADRAAHLFVPVLLALSALVFGVWHQDGDGYPGRAWQIAVTVLMAASPCALSLATPAALAAAGERLLRHGVLVLRAHTLETFDRATHVVFGKTGTLTRGEPLLRQALPVGALGIDVCLGIAAALEAGQPHPLAAAIRAACVGGDAAHAEGVVSAPGMGVEGWVDGCHYRLGSAAWVGGVAGGMARAAAPAGTTSVWLGNNGGWLARFDLADSVRPDAPEVVRRLRAAGKTVLLLSSDEQGATQAVAAQVGISGALGGKLPDEKLRWMQHAQQQGAVVAMVGSGALDAALLDAADVSFAMGRGAALARQQPDAVLPADALLPLAEALGSARRTHAAIRQNLIWACIYNMVALPLAALGLLAPWAAGAAMAASSALVVLNALRLRRA